MAIHCSSHYNVEQQAQNNICAYSSSLGDDVLWIVTANYKYSRWAGASTGRASDYRVRHNLCLMAFVGSWAVFVQRFVQLSTKGDSVPKRTE